MGKINKGNKGLEEIFIVSRVKVEEKALFLCKQQRNPDERINLLLRGNGGTMDNNEEKPWVFNKDLSSAF